MNEKKKNCLNCRIQWDRETRCEICRWEDRDNPSLFYQITRSPEVLAPKLVYSLLAKDICTRKKTRYYYSTITGQRYDEEAKAIAATLEKLREV